MAYIMIYRNLIKSVTNLTDIFVQLFPVLFPFTEQLTLGNINYLYINKDFITSNNKWHF